MMNFWCFRHICNCSFCGFWLGTFATLFMKSQKRQHFGALLTFLWPKVWIWFLRRTFGSFGTYATFPEEKSEKAASLVLFYPVCGQLYILGKNIESLVLLELFFKKCWKGSRFGARKVRKFTKGSTFGVLLVYYPFLAKGMDLIIIELLGLLGFVLLKLNDQMVKSMHFAKERKVKHQKCCLF